MKNPIPESALPNHIGFLGITGSGKTSAAKSGIVEPALERNERVIIIDPAGVWWGLRTKADGKGKGYQIYIFGGSRGDYPLSHHDGKLLAEAFATSSDSAVFDVSEMMPGEQAQFFTDFVNTFRAKNRGSVNFIIEESHIFMPQAGEKGGWTPKMLHAGNNLVALGRSRGFRIALLSQRPAKLHKDSLTQVQTLVAMCVMAPQDRDAIDNWMKGQPDVDKRKEILASLASLRPGQGWVWSPRAGVLECSQFPMPKTFDSSKAPDFEEKEGSAPVLVPVKMDEIKTRLGKVEIDRKANDPKELKAEISRLKAELAKPVEAKVDEAWLAGIVKNHGEDEFARGAVEGYHAGVKALGEIISKRISDLDHIPLMCPYHLSTRKGEVMPFTIVSSTHGKLGPYTKAYQKAQNAPIASKMPVSTQQNAGSGEPLPEGERAVLKVLAQYRDVGYSLLSIHTDRAERTLQNILVALRSKEYVISQNGVHNITGSGLAALGPIDPLPTGAELRSYWLQRLPSGESKVLDFICSRYPDPVTGTSIDDATGIAARTRQNILVSLVGRRLVNRQGAGVVTANPELF